LINLKKRPHNFSYMHYTELSKKIAEHIVVQYIENADERMYFHNLSYPARLQNHFKKINTQFQLDERDFFIVTTALWFHNLGFQIERNSLPELNARLAADALKNLQVDEEDINEIKDCLQVPGAGENGISLNRKIVNDSIYFDLGTEQFREYFRLMRKEREAYANRIFEDGEWTAYKIKILEGQVYQTDFCQSLLNKKKEENLNYLKAVLDKKDIGTSVKKTGDEIGLYDGKYSSQLKKSKHHLRSVQTMFKSSSANHQRLSMMADNKAFIMITVNSIIISLVIGLIIGKFVQVSSFLVPTILILTVNIVTITYAVLATRPRIPDGKFTKEQLERRSVNLLFFGSYYKMDLKDFESGIRQLMDDSEFLYGSLIKDIYWQGRTLGRKFRLLRISYDVFMYGCAVSVLAYIITAVLTKG